MLNLSGHETPNLRKFAHLDLQKILYAFRHEHLMRASHFSNPARRIGFLLWGCFIFSAAGCAMFEDDTQPKYTRNSPSSVTRHAPKPSSEKDADPISFLGRERPKP